MSNIAYLSLGSNLGDRAANLRKAIERINQVAAVLRVSSFYETEPMEVRDQPWFLNCALSLETQASARELLLNLQAIERELGRERDVHKGPRTIDIDLLLFGNEVIAAEGLMVPHPAMQERRFVLAPLVEIAPELLHPVLKKSVAELLRSLRASDEVRRIE